MFIGLHAKYPLTFVRFYWKLNFLGRFRKYSNKKFRENPSSESRVVLCRRMDRWTDGQTWRS